MYLFQNVKDDIRRNLFEQHLQWVYIEEMLSDNQSDPNKKQQHAFHWQGFITGCTQRCIPSLQEVHINELHERNPHANERDQSLLVWLNKKMEGQSISVRSCVIYLGFEYSANSCCQSTTIYLFKRGLRSENGMNSSVMSPSRASLAAESAAGFPLMPTWPETQTQTNSISSWTNCATKTWTDFNSCKEDEEEAERPPWESRVAEFPRAERGPRATELRHPA